MVERLPSMLKTLGSIPSATKKKKKGDRDHFANAQMSSLPLAFTVLEVLTSVQA